MLPRIENNTTEDKDVRNSFRLKIENKAIKDKIIGNIRPLFELEKEDYYKPVITDNKSGNNYI